MWCNLRPEVCRARRRVEYKHKDPPFHQILTQTHHIVQVFLATVRRLLFVTPAFYPRPRLSKTYVRKWNRGHTQIKRNLPNLWAGLAACTPDMNRGDGID